ncbi:MAG TPA: protein translocase subunit SecF [Kofleriaceae bacterium]|jgi:preprotein translocase subunit SecF
MSEHKHFRYLLPPGTNFQFVAKFKAWIWLSVLLSVATIAILFFNKSHRGEYMNWTIDFKGGTEVTVAFKDKSGTYLDVDAAKLRAAFDAAKEHVELSGLQWSAKDANGKEIQIKGAIVRTTRFSALKAEDTDASSTDVTNAFKDKGIIKAAWTGDRLNIRSKQLIPEFDVGPVLAKHGLEPKPWTAQEQGQFSHPDEGTLEYNQWYSVYGLDRQYEQILEKALPGTEIDIVQVDGVGAKAGDKLRDDAAKSIIYAIFLIMLYLAFRFDIRYAPGAAFATIHDAIMVVGVFALTWTEVSLTTVAGLLTVMGYSVNETVIGFDRIRENEAKLKDKSIERIIDVSINERLSRTIMTASTVFATTLVMNIFGTGLVKNFAFAMNVGVIVATYSSIFLAAPVFLWITKKWYSGAPVRRRVAVSASSVAPEKVSSEDAADE